MLPPGSIKEARTDMTISLMRLPYARDALAPAISKETLDYHYGKHHKGYVDKTNKAIEGTELEDAALEKIIVTAAENDDQGLFNNAAQVYNHGFYWHSLAPKRSKPSKDLAAVIERDFGSLKELEEKLKAEASGHFGSGWAWLVVSGGKLKIISTHDARTTPTKDVNPLLTIDVWEHAYYLDRQNDRGAYLKNVIGKLLNWEFASQNFERGTGWTYPS
jgi:superoxide dismutase, Fe-Mn family